MSADAADSAIITALNHVTRRQIMRQLEAGVASPKELAAELGESIQNISYHIGVLRRLGLVSVARETPRRGAVERHYEVASRRPTARDVAAWLLDADRTGRGREWRGRVLRIDSEAVRELEQAQQNFWAEVAAIEQRATSRAADDSRKSRRIGLAQIRHDLEQRG
jgi:DNA-binding transcriptional ArsR family regulator